VEALKGQDCYLLVAPTRGINVWCAATGGILTENSVVIAIKTTGIGQLVEHRTLVLPQLSAAGIDCDEIKRRTGWSCIFGPVYAKDIPAYIEAKFRKSPSMQLTEFALGQRLEQAISPTVLLSLISLPVILLIDRSLTGPVLLAVWLVSLFHYIFIFRIPGQFAYQKGLFVGILSMIIYFSCLGFRGDASWKGYIFGGLGLILLSLLISLEVPSVSPLWRCFRSRLKETGLRNHSINIHLEKCNGCRRCLSVCPKGCFEVLNESKKANLLDERVCLKCRACIRQCHPEALEFARAG
jgi:NAD-dependent dihydropyrimidine dehydrogenase PreA subunit